MTPPPTALPDITDPSTFAARAQAWVLWQSIWYAELAAIIGITIPAGSAAAGTLTGDTLAANVTKYAGGNETLKTPWTYTYVITAGDIIAARATVPITAVTIAKVRSLSITYYTASVIYEVETTLIVFRWMTATTAVANLGASAVAGDMLRVTIIEAV